MKLQKSLPLMHKNYSIRKPDKCIFAAFRRLARVVEEARLESVYTGNRIKSSNLLVSANRTTNDVRFFYSSTSD